MNPRTKKIAGHVLGLVLGVGIGLLILHSFILPISEREPEFIDRPIVEGIDTSYAGKYEDNPKVRALLAKAPALRAEVLKKVSTRTGLKVVEPEKIVLSFRDASPDFGYKAVSRRVVSPAGLLQFTEIGLERYVAGSLDIERVTTHEFTHSVIRQAMAERYKDMPRWFREGIAVWTADQLDSKTRLEVGRALYRGDDPLSALDGLIEERQLGANYLDEGFLFAFLEKKHGIEGVRRVLQQVVVDGADHDDALESVTGVSLSDFIESSRRYGEQVVKGILDGSGADQLTAAVAKAREKDEAGAIEAIRTLLKEHPDSFLVPVAHFLLATLVYEINSPEAALTALDAVIAKGTEYPWLATEATYIRARRLLMAGHYGRAARAFEDFIRDYTWNGPERMADAKCNLAESLIGAGEPERAGDLIRPSLEFLQPVQADRTRAILRDALRMSERVGSQEADSDSSEDRPQIEADAAYARKGTYADFPRLAATCQVDSDCVVVGLPKCIEGCSQGPCGSIGWETEAAVNKDVRSRYLAMLEDQELAKCADVDCEACGVVGQADGSPAASNRPTAVARQAECISGACVLRASD